MDEPAGGQALEALFAHGLCVEFAVITADNPLGRLQSREENEQASIRLESRLAELLVHCVPCDGCCRQALHRERGFATELPLAKAIEIAAEFGQSAIYWFDRREFWLVPVLEPAVAERLAAAPPAPPGMDRADILPGVPPQLPRKTST